MRRRTLLSSSLGLGSLAGLAGLTGAAGGRHAPERMAPAEQATRQELVLHSGSALAFGTTVTIRVLHADPQSADLAIRNGLREVQKIDALMSLYREQSQVFQLNRSGVLTAPAPHLLHVLAMARHLSVITAGAFDITVQPLWRAFSQARSRAQLPTSAEIAAARSHVSWQHLEAEPHQVRFTAPGMAITLNGLAQGYALDLAIEALQAGGIQHALLDTGEFGALGRKKPDQPWHLGVSDPRHTDLILARLQMDGRKVATSGDYESAFDSDFVHHHIFDPSSGVSPAELAGVTVVAPTGILADGLSTAFMVMGSDKALALANQLPDVDTMLVRKNGTVIKTANFPEV